MEPQTHSSDIVVIGYGSLMSGLGLLPFGRLRVRSASRVALFNARRGFGKFSQRGDRFTMVLEPVRAEQPIDVRTLTADVPPSDALEGIGLLVQPNDFAKICDREGYSGGAVQRFRQEAAAKGQDLAAFLWSILKDAGFDIRTFRERLFKLVGYTSPHYLPHPVRLDGNRCAVTFLAPGREGSGSARVVPVRVRTGNESLMTATAAWHHKSNSTQLAYTVACLLGGVHGICVQDLLMPLVEDRDLCERIRKTVSEEKRQELSRFLEVTGIEHRAYWNAFGPPTQSVRRSGLEEFVRGCK